MAADKDTGMRVSWRTKERLRKAIKSRGFPDSVSDDDALSLVLDWVEELVPAGRNHNGA